MKCLEVLCSEIGQTGFTEKMRYFGAIHTVGVFIRFDTESYEVCYIVVIFIEIFNNLSSASLAKIRNFTKKRLEFINYAADREGLLAAGDAAGVDVVGEVCVGCDDGVGVFVTRHAVDAVEAFGLAEVVVECGRQLVEEKHFGEGVAPAVYVGPLVVGVECQGGCA